MKQHLYNKEEYGRRVIAGEIDLGQYYDVPASVEVEKAKLIIAHLFEKKREMILDLGCSLGFYSFQFVKENKFVVGVDYEMQSLRTANKKKSTLNTISEQEKNNINFLNADALQLPFQDEAFDKISNVDFIEHIVPEYQQRVVKEMYRILKKDGKVYMYTPNYIRVRMEYFINKMKYALKGRHYGWQESKPYKDNPELQDHQDTLLHVGLLSFEKVKRLFESQGFIVDQVIYVEYSVPFLFSLSQKIIKTCNIKKPPFYGIFCSNSSIVFRKPRTANNL